jgi:PAS domain S-box-containing protein
LEFSACPAQRLEMDLDTQKTELAIQNQELRESQQRAEEARDRYSDLYDFAPVGYATLNRQGNVKETNLTGAMMLGVQRKQVIDKPLILWMDPSSHTTFFKHLHRVFQTKGQVMDEILFHSQDGLSRTINMISSVVTHGKNAWETSRTALVDISPLKQKELELTDSRQKLRNLSAHLDKVREFERRHLAREIHDELGQKLTALRFEVSMLNAGDGASKPDLALTAGMLLKQIDETIESVRAIASDLRPAVLDLGLIAAVEWQMQEFRRRSGIACHLQVGTAEIPLDNDRATAVFRIIQESLTNILRHANASEVQLQLELMNRSLQIHLSDNGVGISTDALSKSRSFGIAGMRERIRLLDGEIDIVSQPGQGTHINIVIPLTERRKERGNRN